MNTQFKRRLALPACAAMALAVSGCSDSDDDAAAPAPPPPPPPPPAMETTFDVTPCLTQEILPGVTVADAVIPDTLKINFSLASGFPNGRALGDPVINRILNVLFLDLSVHPATTFENFDNGEGVNNNENDRAFLARFPYLAPPTGQADYNAPMGGNLPYNFRTDGASQYVVRDRMGQPAVSTALVTTENKIEFNDDTPADDLTGDSPFFKWGPEFAMVLTQYTNALADDLTDLGLTPCAVPDDS